MVQSGINELLLIMPSYYDILAICTFTGDRLNTKTDLKPLFSSDQLLTWVLI